MGGTGGEQWLDHNSIVWPITTLKMTMLAYWPLAMSRLDIFYPELHQIRQNEHECPLTLYCWYYPLLTETNKHFNKFLEEEFPCTFLYWQPAKHVFQTHLSVPAGPMTENRFLIHSHCPLFWNCKLRLVCLFVQSMGKTHQLHRVCFRSSLLGF